MQFQLQEHLIRVAVIHLSGRLDAFSAPDFRARVMDVLDEGHTNLVVDLSEVTFFDSAALAVLVSAVRRSRLAGGDVRLVWPKTEEAQRIIRLTKFDRVFLMADTVEDARASFGGA